MSDNMYGTQVEGSRGRSIVSFDILKKVGNNLGNDSSVSARLVVNYLFGALLPIHTDHIDVFLSK